MERKAAAAIGILVLALRFVFFTPIVQRSPAA